MSHQLGSLMDWFSTALDLAGLKEPSDRIIDGISLLPLFHNGTITNRSCEPTRQHCYLEGGYYTILACACGVKQSICDGWMVIGRFLKIANGDSRWNSYPSFCVLDDITAIVLMFQSSSYIVLYHWFVLDLQPVEFFQSSKRWPFDHSLAVLVLPEKNCQSSNVAFFKSWKISTGCKSNRNQRYRICSTLI